MRLAGYALPWPALALVLAPSLARAEGGFSLRWSDTAGLSPGSEHDFDARLSQRLGHPAFDATAAANALQVTWQGSAELCRVELELLRGDEVLGTRSLESPSGDCRSLWPALLTVAALLLESQAEQAPAPEPEKPPPPPAPREPTPAPRPRAQARRGATLLVSGGATLGLGLAPKSELGATGALVAAPLPPLRVGLSGTLYVQRQYGAAPGFSLEHRSASLLACGMPILGRLSLGACAVGTWHHFASNGVALPHPQPHQMNVGSVGLELRAEWRLSRHLVWALELGSHFAPRPLYFYFTTAPGDDAVLYRQSHRSDVASLGLTLEVP